MNVITPPPPHTPPHLKNFKNARPLRGAHTMFLFYLYDRGMLYQHDMCFPKSCSLFYLQNIWFLTVSSCFQTCLVERDRRCRKFETTLINMLKHQHGKLKLPWPVPLCSRPQPGHVWIRKGRIEWTLVWNMEKPNKLTAHQFLSLTQRFMNDKRSIKKHPHILILL